MRGGDGRTKCALNRTREKEETAAIGGRRVNRNDKFTANTDN